MKANIIEMLFRLTVPHHRVRPQPLRVVLRRRPRRPRRPHARRRLPRRYHADRRRRPPPAQPPEARGVGENGNELITII